MLRRPGHGGHGSWSIYSGHGNLERSAENLQPDLAGPHPKRCLPPLHFENQRSYGAVAGLLRRAGGRHCVEYWLCQACEIVPDSPAKMPV